MCGSADLDGPQQETVLDLGRLGGGHGRGTRYREKGGQKEHGALQHGEIMKHRAGKPFTTVGLKWTTGWLLAGFVSGVRPLPTDR
jgi:hypothetical protein